MSEEVKELIQKIEDVRDNPAILDDDGWCDNWMVMSAKECNILLDYINQLEEKEELHLNRIDELTDRIVKSQEKVNQLKKDKFRLAEKLSQLEANRDEALNLMEKCKFDKTDKYIAISEYKEYQKLKAILERGKE